MTAAKYDIYVEQGATFTLGFVWHEYDPDADNNVGDPVDLTGCIARMQIRKSQQAPLLIDATSENGKITLGGPSGRIDVLLTDDDTDLLTSKVALYDLEVEKTDGTVFRLLQGGVTVSPNITQETEDPVVGG